MSDNRRPLLWTAEDFLAAVEGRAEGEPLAAIDGLSIDSRTVSAGEAFFAILGDRFDGHDFAADALANGAAAVVVKSAFEGDVPTGSMIRVDEPLAALRRLALAARARSRAKICGITGSVGKTGTKRMLAAALGANGPTHASPASFNNHWGVPFSLAGLPGDAAYAVFEMGMNHAGEIAPLSRMVRPHVAIITTVEPVHIGYLGSIEAISDAKAEIFEGVEAGGVAVLNRDNAQFDRLSATARSAGLDIVSFGRNSADVRLIRHVEQDEGSTLEADVMGTPVACRLGAPGAHVAQNALAVLAAVSLVGADLALAALSLADVSAARGRGARQTVDIGTGTVTLIDESYNANPASMSAAFSLLAAAEPGPRGRRIAVLGDMLELGDFSEQYHRDLAEPLRSAGTDLVYACGPHMEALWNVLPDAIKGRYAPDAGALGEAVTDSLRAGDVVMVKGSLGSRMGPIVAQITALASASAES